MRLYRAAAATRRLANSGAESDGGGAGRGRGRPEARSNAEMASSPSQLVSLRWSSGSQVSRNASQPAQRTRT